MSVSWVPRLACIASRSFLYCTHPASTTSAIVGIGWARREGEEGDINQYDSREARRTEISSQSESREGEGEFVWRSAYLSSVCDPEFVVEVNLQNRRLVLCTGDR